MYDNNIIKLINAKFTSFLSAVIENGDETSKLACSENKDTKTLLHLFFIPYNLKIVLRPLGIDKITEKAQVSEDGTMVAVPHSDSRQTAADSSAAAGASDTESNSERDHEVREASRLSSLFLPAAKVICSRFILSSALPRRVRIGEEPVVECVVNSGSLER